MTKDYSLEELDQLEREQRKQAEWVVRGIALVGGIAGIWFNWHYALTFGMYNELLAFLSPAVVIGVIYSIFFPNDFSEQNKNKLSFRKLSVIVLGLLLCLGHLLIFEFGLI